MTEPTLLSLYPGVDAKVTVDRNFTAGTSSAQIWFNDTEQFFCSMSNCTQTADTGGIIWACPGIRCQCYSGSAICGPGIAGISLKTIIESLNGAFTLTCSNTSCLFDEIELRPLFSKGIHIDNCTYGECIYPSNIIAITGVAQPSSLNPDSVAAIAIFSFLAAFLIATCCLAKRRQIILSRQEVVATSHGVRIEWRNLGYTIPVKREKKRTDNHENGTKVERFATILSDVSGAAEPGQVVAVMGPSGAGKTTLVDILAGKAKSGKTVGTILIDGKPINTREIRKLVGYVIGDFFVDQDLVLPPEQTVFEALLFSAQLRLPESVPLSEKKRIVEDIISRLGLEGKFILLTFAPHRLNARLLPLLRTASRGLSGGEKRRVSIGLELVISPAILILDEPISGLDSYSAHMVIRDLETLAKGDNATTIILTIHQPRSDIFQLFNRVVVLAGGQTLYIGAPNEAAEDFKNRGLESPANYNIADYMLDVALQPALLARAQSHGKQDEPLSENKTDLTSVKDDADDPFTPKTSFLTQFSLISARNWQNLVRNKALLFTHVIVAIVLGVFIGGLYYQSPVSIAGFQNRIGCLFFLLALLAFSSLGALGAFLNDRLLFIKERSNGYYKPFPYVVSKLLFDLIPLRVIPALLLGCIAYWMVGLSPNEWDFLRFLLILVLFNGATGLICLVIAAGIQEAGMASLVASIVMLFMMLFGGLLINQDKIPAALSWLQYLSVFRYGFEALAANEANSLEITDSLDGITINVTGSFILQWLFGFDTNGFWLNAVVLVAFWVGLIALVVILVLFMQFSQTMGGQKSP
ncbi:hypothetical protein BC937DRAFT_86556 [Endogone sp. FLAS-F59071]|nr:hypothetical protein BC937DRAFT_86556 [Endogone sp. FLAS-F59071]|eukprot:RUS20020.1 hypothetical protein BC937DRAFT_86556 [Endogone sp. FLAS-F59071]